MVFSGSTNRFITATIAVTLGVENLIACHAEIIDGIYTVLPSVVPSYQAGKVTGLQTWLEGRDRSLDGAVISLR